MNPAPLLQHTVHRPYPMPRGPWVMQQTWYNLLFAHWPIPAEVMRAKIPDALELDTFEGYAWIGVVPFGMQDVYPRGTFAVPGLSKFLELNVRTYVVRDGKPGVWFFSLDAANAAAVQIARAMFHLPYYEAEMALHVREGWFDYTSIRTHRGAGPAAFRGRYRPTGPVYRAQHGTIDQWLTERYCLYAIDQNEQLYRGDIHHLPWPLQPAELQLSANTMTHPIGLGLPLVNPLLHFARQIEVVVWALERCETG